MSDRIHAVFSICRDDIPVEERAAAIVLEQTVELPDDAVRDPDVRARALGRVDRIDGERVSVSWPGDVLDGSVAQWLNVLFGNVSLQPEVELVDFALPDAVLEALPGPRHGIAGWRRLLGAGDRAMTCTALKPVGADVAYLASVCRTFAKAGIDVVKDDHGLADQATAPFADRVRACVEAAGDDTLYVPNLIGSAREVEERYRIARAAGARAVMLEPSLLGLPTFADLVARTVDLPVIAHPAFAGATRVAPDTMLGTVYRLLGADAAVFPHAGGRFGYTADTCRAIADRLRRPAGHADPVLPVPAGGMTVERVPELLQFYGRDVLLLMGGTLYLAGDDLEARARALVEAVTV